jgi:hypothetical protein
MSLLSKTSWFKRLAVVLMMVFSIGALTVPAAPANARVFVGFGIGAPVGWGYYPPPPYYGYYGYPYYGYPYYRAYYGYPGFFIDGTFGPHRHWHHHHW